MTKMQLIGKIKSTNRTVYYIDSTKKWWWRNLPEKNWIGMICSGDSKKIKKTIIKYCLNKNISHITVVWRYADGIESDFDSEIVGRKIESWEYPSNDDAFNDSPCTTSNDEFKEGFWYCCYPAFWIWDETIKNVVCVDLTWKMESNVLKNLVKKFNTWYIPGASHELEKYVEEWYPILHKFCEFKKANCCKELPPKALIPMTVDTGKSMRRVFKNLWYKRKDEWWVGVLECKKCNQCWLMAQEERIHDNWFIEKMNAGDLEKIKNMNLWPDSLLFSFYYLLYTAKVQGKYAILFHNPADWKDTIYDTVKIIMTEKNKISVEELTEILNYDYEWMKKIALEYVENNEDTVMQNNHIVKKYN